EDALRESEDFLKEAQRIANMGSWIWDLKTNDVIWSDNLCLMHGMKPGEFDGQFDTAMSLIHPDDLESVQKKIQQLLDGKQPIEFEYRIIARNGVVKVVRGFQRLAFDDEGNIVRMVGILQDITERKRAEEAIQRLNSLLSSIIESPDNIIIFVLDASYNYLSFNIAHAKEMKKVYDADIE
ncbi:MAG: PAS domain-containing protein, partial [Cytophagales bacterium]|nr:PAS domain-containing protein [Cytophagales bacterium]